MAKLKIFNYLLREIKNLFEFYIIPILVVILPHKIYYPIFKFICKHTFFYSVYSKGSNEWAKKFIENTNSSEIWDRNVRLLYLIDISDSWLAKLRPKKAGRVLIRHGEWIKDGGFLALSAHWGTGFISLLDLKMSGFSPFFVFSDTPVEFKYQSLVEGFYRKSRRNYVNKISGSVAIPTGGGYNTIKERIFNKGVPVILYDAPKDEKESKYFLKAFNRKYNIASGFISLIYKENIPFQLFSVKLDFDTGIRNLRIQEPRKVESEQFLIKELSSFFENLLIESPEHWYFWRQSSSLFVDKSNNIKIPVLAYHSANIAGNEYHNNDHVALKADLKMFQENDIEIIPASVLVDFLYGQIYLDENKKYVVLTFDDGNELDFTDWNHPEFGEQKSFYSELKAVKQFTHATAFVIASADVRKSLEQTCLDGHQLLGESWWSQAEQTKVISIENHSWDHVHPTLETVKQQNNEKGNFALVDNIHDAKSQIEESTSYIESVLEHKSISLFAYPYGHYNSFLTDEYFPKMQNEIKAAFTCDPEYVNRLTNVWKIPRFVCGLNWKTVEELKNIIL